MIALSFPPPPLAADTILLQTAWPRLCNMLTWLRLGHILKTHMTWGCAAGWSGASFCLFTVQWALIVFAPLFGHRNRWHLSGAYTEKTKEDCCCDCGHLCEPPHDKIHCGKLVQEMGTVTWTTADRYPGCLMSLWENCRVSLLKDWHIFLSEPLEYTSRSVLWMHFGAPLEYLDRSASYVFVLWVLNEWVTVNSEHRAFGSHCVCSCSNLFSFINTCVWFGCAKRVWFLSSSVLLCFLFFLLCCTLCDTAGSSVTDKICPSGNQLCVCVCMCLFLSRMFVTQRTEANSSRQTLKLFTVVWAGAVDGLQTHWLHMCTHRVHTHVNTARRGSSLMKTRRHAEFTGNQSCCFISKSN